jgi:hypothetical protein
MWHTGGRQRGYSGKVLHMTFYLLPFGMRRRKGDGAIKEMPRKIYTP